MYISKQNDFPSLNYIETELSFTCRKRTEARCTQVFDTSDPFLLEHEQQYRMLYELLWEIRSRLPCVKSMPKLVRKIWSDWCMHLLLRMRIICRGWEWKGVYLHGPSGVGISTALQKGLLLLGFGRWHMPLRGNVFSGWFVRCEYDVVVFKEFKSANFRQNFSQIKNLLEGGRFGNDITYTNNRSIIFVDLESIATLCDDFCMYVTYTNEMLIFFH